MRLLAVASKPERTWLVGQSNFYFTLLYRRFDAQLWIYVAVSNKIQLKCLLQKAIRSRLFCTSVNVDLHILTQFLDMLVIEIFKSGDVITTFG